MPTPWLIIYRHTLLNYSETFIEQQGVRLQSFRAFYLGLQQVEGGIKLPRDTYGVLLSRSGFFSGLRLAYQLFMKLRHLKPRLIHAHFEGDGIVALYLAKLLGLQLIVTCHGFDVTMTDEHRWSNILLRFMYRWQRKRLQRHARLFIAVSEHIKRCMMARGYPENRIVVHYIGVDCQYFFADPSIVREPIVLFVGRLVEKKGCEYLIRAMCNVKQTHPSARLVIIGEGILQHELYELSRNLNVPAEFLQIQPPSHIKEWMNKSRVLCVPTLRAENGDMDGCCMVFAEAQAMGLPVVSFNTGGTLEIIRDQETGLLVPARDHQGLAGAITQLVKNDALWEKFSKAARLHAIEHFNLARQNERLEILYQKITK